VPKSKGRKTKKNSRSYVPRKEHKKPKASPPWYPYFFLGLMGAGILIIVLNYMGKVPGSDGFDPVWLWVGLALIGGGFLAATNYR
jgi:hypothetical protein